MLNRILVVAFTAACLFGALHGQDPVLEKGAAEVPASVSEAIRNAVSGEALTVSLGNDVLARFWLRSELSAAASPSSELGVAFGAVETGSFVGVMEVIGGWSDYKENAIAAGTYILRYGIMPADGNHMGVSTYRDFLMLIAPDLDQDPSKNLSFEELLAGSTVASGVTHPGVLALFPIWDEITEPTLVKNDMDQWTLAVKIGGQVLGLVVSGHGEV